MWQARQRNLRPRTRRETTRKLRNALRSTPAGVVARRLTRVAKWLCMTCCSSLGSLPKRARILRHLSPTLLFMVFLAWHAGQSGCSPSRSLSKRWPSLSLLWSGTIWSTWKSERSVSLHLAHRQPYLAPTSFMVCAEIRLRLAVVVLGRGALFNRLYVVAGGSASSSSSSL